MGRYWIKQFGIIPVIANDPTPYSFLLASSLHGASHHFAGLFLAACHRTQPAHIATIARALPSGVLAPVLSPP